MKISIWFIFYFFLFFFLSFFLSFLSSLPTLRLASYVLETVSKDTSRSSSDISGVSVYVFWAWHTYGQATPELLNACVMHLSMVCPTPSCMGLGGEEVGDGHIYNVVSPYLWGFCESYFAPPFPLLFSLSFHRYSCRY